MDVLRNNLRLEVEDFGDVPELNSAVQAYCMRNYIHMLGHQQAAMLHMRGDYVKIEQ